LCASRHTAGRPRYMAGDCFRRGGIAKFFEPFGWVDC
jgi:hypothetical protein